VSYYGLETQQSQTVVLHMHEVLLAKVKFLVILVSFLVQLQSRYVALVVALVTFLQVQFSTCEGASHLSVGVCCQLGRQHMKRLPLA
jgi:hypothetical protein